MPRQKSSQSGAKKTGRSPDRKRVFLSQSDVPSRTLQDALKVPQAIIDNYAGVPTAPHDIALAVELSPTSSGWRDLAAASAGYGLTKGSWSAGRIAITDLGRQATAPVEDGADSRARAAAALVPKVFGGFFRRYNRNKFPADHIARNVLSQEYGIPTERTEAVLRILRENGQFVGFIRDTKTGPFVAIDESGFGLAAATTIEADDAGTGADAPMVQESSSQVNSEAAVQNGTVNNQSMRVFISHGRNKALVEQVKDILTLYDIQHEVAVEGETAAIPVPEKVVNAMRRCRAGVMIVSADERSSAGGELAINTNVLIEIGAAFVLYDRRVILLWDKRLRVPSNLQGLYRLEFEGEELSFGAGTKLAKAVKSLRE